MSERRRESKADREERRERIRIADAYTCTPVSEVMRRREVAEVEHHNEVARRCHEDWKPR